MENDYLADKIYEVRGVKVMLDFELAEIYGFTTSAFNQQVKRNIKRFDDDFRFQLTRDELDALSISQNVMSIQTKGTKGGRSKLPYAFTESGIYMLMTVLKGELAIEQSKALIRTFQAMKEYIANNQFLMPHETIREIELKQYQLSERVEKVEKSMVRKADLSELMKLFADGVEAEDILILDGQPFKADIAYQSIYSKAKESIIVIDNYIAPKTLHHLAYAKRGVKIIVISDNKTRPSLKALDYNDFLMEYPEKEIRFIQAKNRIHDRQILVDFGTGSEKIYVCGSSSKDAGKKITDIIRIDYKETNRSVVEELLENDNLELK